MNAASSPLRVEAVTLAERVARRNLERARVLGNTKAIAAAAKWDSQIRSYGATVRRLDRTVAQSLLGSVRTCASDGTRFVAGLHT